VDVTEEGGEDFAGSCARLGTECLDAIVGELRVVAHDILGSIRCGVAVVLGLCGGGHDVQWGMVWCVGERALLVVADFNRLVNGNEKQVREREQAV